MMTSWREDGSPMFSIWCHHGKKATAVFWTCSTWMVKKCLSEHISFSLSLERQIACFFRSAFVFLVCFAENFQPTEKSRTLVPQWNNLVWFEVTAASHHQVSITHFQSKNSCRSVFSTSLVYNCTEQKLKTSDYTLCCPLLKIFGIRAEKSKISPVYFIRLIFRCRRCFQKTRADYL